MLARSVVISLLIASCTTTARPSPSPGVTETPAASATASSTATASPSPTATGECAVRVLATMSEEQRIGQLFLLGLDGDQLGAEERNAIRMYHFGSVWFVVQSAAGASAIRTVADAVQVLATQTTAGVGFFVAANQEGGIIQSLKGAGFSTIPSALDQSTIDPATLRTRAALWGRELASAGVNLNFAPVLDVVPPGTDAQNEPIGALQRGYGHDPATVSAHAVAFMRGMEDAGIATTGKHFPGLGRVTGNTDFTAAVVDTVTTPTDAYLAPFRDAVTAGIPMVMVALAKYQQIDPAGLAVFSPTVMRQMLRTSLNFNGVVVSDDLGATVAVANIPPADRAINFLMAGGDFIISKTIAPANAMATAISARASTDAAFKTRVDDAALRILRAKAARGLVRCA
jgi:beta-N-acetylhexosaminidase